MYEPNIKTTENLIKSINQIEDVRDLLRTIPVLPIIEEAIQRQALVETVHYTAQIEGNPLDIRVAARLREYQTAKPGATSEQELVNLYRMMDFIHDIADKKNIPIDEEVIRQIHAFIVRDIPSQGPPGAYKSAANAIQNSVTGERIFLPPSPNDTPRLMSELTAWLSQRRLMLHPVMTAGIAHLELVAIHPFADGNGRTARALADLILWRYGYTFRYLFSWVRQVGIDMGTYHQRLHEALGDEYGANADPTAWLEYFAEAIAKSLAELKPDLQEIRGAFIELYNVGAEMGLAIDQVEAAVFARFRGSVSTAEYMRTKALSRSTVVKRLSELVEVGLLQVVGKGRSVRYVPIPRKAADTEHSEAEGVQLGSESAKEPNE